MIPEGAAEVGLAILAGVLGWLGRSVTDLRSRVAVAEARQADRNEDIARLEGKVDRLTSMVERMEGRSAHILPSRGAP